MIILGVHHRMCNCFSTTIKMVITECYFGRDCIAFVDAYFEIMLLGIKMVMIKAIMIVIIVKKIRYRRKNKSSASLPNAG